MAILRHGTWTGSRCEDRTNGVHQLRGGEWLPERGYVRQRSVGGQRIADVQDGQPGLGGTHPTDQLGRVQIGEPGIGDDQVEIGDVLGQLAGRETVVGGKNTVPRLSENGDQLGEQLGVVVGDDDA